MKILNGFRIARWVAFCIAPEVGLMIAVFLRYLLAGFTFPVTKTDFLERVPLSEVAQSSTQEPIKTKMPTVKQMIEHLFTSDEEEEVVFHEDH